MRLAVPWLCLCVLIRGTPDRPELSAEDIVNAADHSARGVTPGEIVVLFPSHAGPDVLAGAQLNAEGKVTTELGETRVWFDDVAAPVAYSVRGQVGAVVPYEIANKKSTQVVVEYQGARSAPVTLAVVESAPALFTLDSSGKGQAGMLNETGCCNSTRNPAARGSLVALYATGAGQTSPPGITGSVSTQIRVADYPVPQLAVKVTVGGVPAEILYAGAAPHAIAGLLQVNFRVPANAPIGDAVPVVLTVGELHSPEGVTMAVRSSVQRILVIDNDAATRTSFHKVLTEAGYDVLAAQTSPDALAQASEHSIDLVVCSVAISTETMTILRAELPRLKVVATAGALDPTSLRSADLLGAQAIFTKPLTSSLVVQRVRELLRSHPVPYVAGADPPLFPIKRAVAR